MRQTLRGFFSCRLPNLQILKRDSLAVEHAENVVVGLHKEFCRIGEGLIPRKPCRVRVPVRTDDGQGSHMLIERPGYLSRAGLGRKQTIWMDQHNSDAILLLSHRRTTMQEQRCDLATSIHVVIKTQSKAVTILFDSIYIY